MSTHEIRVVAVREVLPHPDADTLSLIKIDGYTIVVKSSEWKAGDLAVHIPPDYVVPQAAQFSFLGDNRRIKARRFRGVYSHGLLTKPPEGSKEGDDVMKVMGIERYEPPIVNSGLVTGGDNCSPPHCFAPSYDVEPWRKYQHLLQQGEVVYVTEKIHGANGRYTYHDNQVFCGSRTAWKKEDEKNLWWVALRQNPALETFIRTNPQYVVYGEVFGRVQDLRYGSAPNEYRFAAFDILDKTTGLWLDAPDFFNIIGEVPIAPRLYVGEYIPQTIERLSNGVSIVDRADHIREGIVIRPERERTCIEIGRVILKVVSDDYLSR